jgi:hypothetical protein
MDKPYTKIIQIIAEPDYSCSTIFYALCADGTVWEARYDRDKDKRYWNQIVMEDKSLAEIVR